MFDGLLAMINAVPMLGYLLRVIGGALAAYGFFKLLKNPGAKKASVSMMLAGLFLALYTVLLPALGTLLTAIAGALAKIGTQIGTGK